MPRLERPIGPDGPIIDLSLWIGPEHEAAMRSRRLPTPSPLTVSGLVDTGARMTAIQRGLATGLALPVHGLVRLKSSVLGEEDRVCPVYSVRATFGPIPPGHAPKWRIIQVVGVTVVSPGAVALIGQDLLATCRFTYDGRKRRLMMSY